MIVPVIAQIAAIAIPYYDYKTGKCAISAVEIDKLLRKIGTEAAQSTIRTDLSVVNSIFRAILGVSKT